MTKIFKLENLSKNNKNLYYKNGNVLTIGFFDGVHIGHKKILSIGKKISLETKIPFIVLTFHPHPNEIIFKNKKFPLLTSLEDRLKSIMNFNVDVIIVIPFTKEFSMMAKDEFLNEIVIKKINPKTIVIGEDFKFGYKAKGNINFLIKYLEDKKIVLKIVPLVKIDKDIISSTLIRELIKKGKVSKANNLLGRNYGIFGSIIKGEGMGRIIGFPTINMKTSKELLLPGDGVYLGKIKSDGFRKYCLINIGIRPTFNGKKRTVEFHILDTEKEKVKGLMKSKILRLYFINKLRNEIKFESVEKLVNQIKKDIKEVRKILKSKKN